MKKLIVLLGFIAFSTSIFAQKTEIKGVLNSGLSSFFGDGAASETFLSNLPPTSRINNPYGSKYSVCYGLSGTIQRVTKRSFIVGLDLGVESVRSKVLINRVSDSGKSLTASGNGYYTHNFLNAYPFWGYRFQAAGFNIDWVLGLDVAYNLKSKVKGSATASDERVFTADYVRKDKPTDVRLRTQVAVSSKGIGAFVGCSFGVVNYQGGLIGGTIPVCFSRVIRFGLTYQLQ